MSTMDKWDTEIAPQLRALRHCGKKAAYYARFATLAMQALSNVPNFETMAQAEIEAARKDFEEAKNGFDAISQRYQVLQAAE